MSNHRETACSKVIKLKQETALSKLKCVYKDYLYKIFNNGLCSSHELHMALNRNLKQGKLQQI